MEKIYNMILEKYGYDEPIFTKDLNEFLNLKPNTFRQTIKRLADNGYLKKVEKGIYFIPKKNSVLKDPKLNVNKIIKKRFLENGNNVIGYSTGINFANSLGLTSQTASIPTVVTNNTSSSKREVNYYNKKVIIKKPKIEINNKNYKLLQVFDLIKDFDRLSEEPLEKAKIKLVKYVKDENLNREDFISYLNLYPAETKVRIFESGVYDEITRK